MGVLSDFREAFREAQEVEIERRRKLTQRRDLTDEDRAGWSDALEQREKAITPRTIQDVRTLIRHRNPIKYRQMEGHFKWLQKEMLRLGLNPEDARYIL